MILVKDSVQIDSLHITPVLNK